MSRRRIVLFVSLGLVVSLVLLAVGGVMVLTQTGWGQDQVRRLVQDRVTAAVHGRVYLGRISGSYLTGLTIDSVEIRDAEDSLFLATGPITVAYDPRDLIDKRLLFSSVDIQHPTVYLRQHENWDWNFRRIFRSGMQGPPSRGPQWGDYLVFDSVRVHDAAFELTLPWHPDDSLHGARRDSAIAAALSHAEPEVRRTREGFTRTWRWIHIHAVLPHVRWADPDSAGRTFAFDTLDLDEREPPFLFRNVRGTVRNLGDSLWATVRHFDLPASTGSGSGKIWWGHDLPTRYALHIVGDSVSLADVDWVYPTLPTTGGGSMDLDIHNERDLHVLDYALSKLDVRTTRSRLRGEMTFGVGGPVLQVKDVNLDAEPVDFDLLRTLNGKAFPVDWQGQLRGTVVARGGPLTHFMVDTAQLTIRDAHVPGAVSTLSGRGGLDILNPGFTVFQHFDVAAQTVDLRTIEYLYPAFPRLHGWLSGTATLDSSWMDVRFSNADVQQHDGDAPPSRLVGNGRITYGDRFMTYDVALFADSLSLTGLHRSYAGLPVKGMVAGTIRAQGTADSLLLDASLRGPLGAASFNGLVDVFPPSLAAQGSGRVVALDPAQLLDLNGVPAGSLTGNYEVNLRGDSIATLDGSALVSLEHSDFDHVQLFGSRARFRFGDARMHIDSLRLETSAATITASGGLGLRRGVVDSLAYEASVDSLGGLRPFLATAAAKASGKPDSLAGALSLTGMVTGNLDSLNARGEVFGSSLYINKDRGASMHGRFAVNDILNAPRGTVGLELDTLVLAGVKVDTIGAELQLATRTSGTFRLGALSDNGPTFAAAGRVSRTDGLIGATVESVNVNLGHDTWTLAAPARISVDSSLLAIDTLRITNGRGGSVAVAGRVPAVDSVALMFRADSVPVRDAATLLQVADTMAGWGALHAGVRGTRARPLASLDATLHDLRYGGMQLERVDATAAYADRRTQAALTIFRGGIPSLQATASLPMEITLSDAPRLLDDSLSGKIRADSADFAIVEAFVPAVTDAKGRVHLDLDVAGTWHHPTVGGVVQMDGGQLSVADIGLTLHDISADLAMFSARDSLAIRRLRAWNATSPNDSVAVLGFVDFADRSNPLFNLRLAAHNFRVMDKRALARLDVSTVGRGITLSGRKDASTLTGSVNVVRGTIYIPERAVAKKQLVSLSYADLEGIIDTAELSRQIKLPSPPSALLKNMTISNVRVTLGDEVWLRSQEANVKLAGSLNVTRSGQRAADGGSPFSRDPALDTLTYRLALDGTLIAERGTYTLSFGPLQREFQVESGTITFYGTPDLNPRINISAIYNVRQYNRQDVKVRAKLSGYLYPGPSLDLESGESYAIPQSDLVSYLCCGVPSFELGANQSYLRTAAQVLLPTASSVLAQTLRGQLGSTFDILQFQAGATDETATNAPTTSAARDFFAGARLGGEKQITNNVFFSISAGLCQLNPNQTGSDPGMNGFFQQLGGKLQYRFSNTLAVDLGVDPPSSALLCGRGLRGFVPTPQQWGLSLSKSWRW
ncbi:MAG: translocation/assembly module TamB domain-containing protein [Gemmatimonadaceae bacterium]